MSKVQIYEKGLSANRNLIALIIISFTMVGIILISWFYFSSHDKNVEEPEKIFNTLIPLFATWIGTVLAFYFGRENFEAASNRYEEMIKKLTPEILDDILVGQLMISKKTMVSKNISDVKEKSVKELIEFMTTVDKSRLPILENDKIKYIIHKPTFMEALIRSGEGELKFDKFAKDNEATITKFITVKEDSILENVNNELSKKSCKDAFILDSDEKVLGWITDTLILGYLRVK